MVGSLQIMVRDFSDGFSHFSGSLQSILINRNVISIINSNLAAADSTIFTNARKSDNGLAMVCIWLVKLHIANR